MALDRAQTISNKLESCLPSYSYWWEFYNNKLYATFPTASWGVILAPSSKNKTIQRSIE